MDQTKMYNDSSSSPFIDQILLDKCLWIIPLETCTSFIYLVYIGYNIISFMMTFVFALRTGALKKLSNPFVMEELSEYLLMAIVGLLAYTAINDNSSERYKICTSIVTFRGISFMVLVATSALHCTSIVGVVGVIFFIAAKLYILLVLWSYCRVLDGIGG
ncbi:uncharacterized protein LOC128985354 [Macrosteles quadrilineatus]|uniref:uncharacterized protein LOC128985354 n=1 Tax=Macrosteles quadrilineatus TaxID=74068 RepID=UPI0023E21251|nr:uncharacterized protein LOC128985354 [Macrosteles quadrilineatus]